MGTIIPMFMRFLEYIRVAQRNLAAQYQQQEAQHQYPSSPGAPPGPAPVAAAPQQFVQTALVDPNDPSKVRLGPARTLTWLSAFSALRSPMRCPRYALVRSAAICSYLRANSQCRGCGGLTLMCVLSRNAQLLARAFIQGVDW